jgi:ABC-type uncharacterized transport system permease subunit
MVTPYDKAIAGFLTSLVALLAAFKLPLGWVSPEVIAAVTPFIVTIVVWLVPNKPATPPPPAPPQP